MCPVDSMAIQIYAIHLLIHFEKEGYYEKVCDSIIIQLVYLNAH